jgi:hypothetical protein
MILSLSTWTCDSLYFPGGSTSNLSAIGIEPLPRRRLDAMRPGAAAHCLDPTAPPGILLWFDFVTEGAAPFWFHASDDFSMPLTAFAPYLSHALDESRSNFVHFVSPFRAPSAFLRGLASWIVAGCKFFGVNYFVSHHPPYPL